VGFRKITVVWIEILFGIIWVIEKMALKEGAGRGNGWQKRCEV
jgi:hypothetical protein